MTPSCDKLDIDQLKKHIPKYYPFLQSHSQVEWNMFLEKQIDDLTSNSQPSEHLQEFRQLIAAGSRVANAPPTGEAEEFTAEPILTPANEEVLYIIVTLFYIMAIYVYS